MARLTRRDEQMLEWLNIVRIADMEAVRWALGAYLGIGAPVGLRKAQRWVSRLIEIGLVRRARPTVRDGSIIWPSKRESGRSAPDLYRQTLRHDIAVSVISAHYLVQGFGWARDRKASSRFDHQADGVATRGGAVELVDVMLLPKPWQRYKTICDSYTYRLEHENATSVAVVTTPTIALAFNAEADKHIFRTQRGKLRTHPVLTQRGQWAEPA